MFIAPGSPWENGYVESFNSKPRGELLNRELFLHIDELRYVVDRWRMDYNHYRPHSSLDYMIRHANFLVSHSSNIQISKH